MKRSGALLTAILMVSTIVGCASKPEPDRYPNVEGECLVDYADDIKASGRDFLAKDEKSGKFIDKDSPENYRITKQTEGGHTISFEVEEDATCHLVETFIEVPAPEPETAELIPEPASPVDPPVPITPDQGMTFGTASIACDNAGKAAFPYGWDAHWTMGLIGEEITADSYFLKASVDVKNESGAETEMVVECKVTGDEHAPEVTLFNVY